MSKPSPTTVAHDAEGQRSQHPAATDFTSIGLLLAAALLWSLNGAFIKAINAQGRGPDGITIAFYRSVFGGLVLLPFAWGRLRTLSRRAPTPSDSSASRGSRTSKHEEPVVCAGGSYAAQEPVAGAYGSYGRRGSVSFGDRWFPRPAALLCAVFFAAMTGCFVVANTMTEAGNAIVLQYTSTLWLFVLSPWLLRERPRMDDAWILAVAMLGVGVIFFGNAGRSLPGLLVALTAGFFYSLLTLMIRRLRTADPSAVTVLNNLGAAVLLLAPVMLWGDLMISRRELALLALMGVVQFSIPYYLYARALTRVPAYQAGLITLAEPVLVPVWTFLAVGELVPASTIAGGGLLLLSIAIFLLKSWQRNKLPPSTNP